MAALVLLSSGVAAVFLAASRPSPAAPGGERVGKSEDHPFVHVREAAVPVLPDAETAVAAANRDDSTSGWDRVKRDCPWPPRPDTWRGLGEDCEEAMDALDAIKVPIRDLGYSRFALDDPVGTRSTVVRALDIPECRVPKGESRPDLYEACAAESMWRLSLLQRKCIDALGADWNERIEFYSAIRSTLDPSTGQLFDEPPRDQEEYYRRVEVTNRFAASGLWQAHLCAQVPPDALDWIDVLPLPSTNPAASVIARLPTQAPELVETARRLGWPRGD